MTMAPVKHQARELAITYDFPMAVPMSLPSPEETQCRAEEAKAAAPPANNNFLMQ